MKRSVKPHALGCFGDIAIALNNKFVRYLETAGKWFTNAIEAANITNPVSTALPGDIKHSSIAPSN